MHRNTKHNGNTQRIRDLLALSPEPLRASHIAARLGISSAAVVALLNNMISRLGGACIAGKDGRFKLYGVPGRDDVKHGKGRANIATQKYLAPPGVLRRDPFEHRKLALDGPR